MSSVYDDVEFGGMPLRNAIKAVNYTLLACVAYWHNIARKAMNEHNVELESEVADLVNNITSDKINRWLMGLNNLNQSNNGDEAKDRQAEARAAGILSEQSIKNIQDNLVNALYPDTSNISAFEKAMSNITKSYGSITNLTNQTDANNRIVTSVSVGSGQWKALNYVVFKDDVDVRSIHQSEIDAATSLINGTHKMFGCFNSCGKNEYNTNGTVYGSTDFIRKLLSILFSNQLFSDMVKSGDIYAKKGTIKSRAQLVFKNGSFYHFCHAVLDDSEHGDGEYDGCLKTMFEFTQIDVQGDTSHTSTVSQRNSGGGITVENDASKTEKQNQQTLRDVSAAVSKTSDEDIDKKLNVIIEKRFPSIKLMESKLLGTNKSDSAISGTDVRKKSLALLDISFKIINILLKGYKGDSLYYIVSGVFDGGRHFNFISKNEATMSSTHGEKHLDKISFGGHDNSPSSTLLCNDLAVYFKHSLLNNIQMSMDGVSRTDILNHLKSVFLFNDEIVKYYISEYVITSDFSCTKIGNSDLRMHSSDDKSLSVEDIDSWINDGIVINLVNLYKNASEKAHASTKILSALTTFILDLCDQDDELKNTLVKDCGGNINNETVISNVLPNRHLDEFFDSLESTTYTYAELVSPTEGNGFICKLLGVVDNTNMFVNATTFKNEYKDTGKVSPKCINNLKNSLVENNDDNHRIFESVDDNIIRSLAILAIESSMDSAEEKTKIPAKQTAPSNRVISLNNFSLDDDD